MKNNSLFLKPIKENWKNITHHDINKVKKYLKKQEISVIDGGVLNEFEKCFADYIGVKYAVAYCNGTAALHAASFACGANETNEFITSSYSYHGTVISLLENRTKVVLVDYEDNSLLINLDEVEKNITSKTKGLMITHCWGNIVDYDKLEKLKNKYNLKIIIDASHAHGAEYKNQKIGSLACEDVVCFSLGKNKLMSAGELGVAVTNDFEIYQKLLFFGHPNRVPEALDQQSHLREFVNGIGNKFRPHSLAMVLALEQIKKYNKKRAKNIETNNILQNEISKIPGFKVLDTSQNCKRVYWKLQILVDTYYWQNIEFEKIVSALKNQGLRLEQWHNYNIEENIKIWNYPRYKNQLILKNHKTSPNNIIVLPGYIDINKKDINKIIEAFKNVSINKGDLK